MPAFFNHTDADRIGTVIRDTAQEFLIDTPKKVMFSIGVKVFSYNSEVNSIRLVLVKLAPYEGAGNDVGDGKSKSNKSRSKMSKSKDSKSKKS